MSRRNFAVLSAAAVAAAAVAVPVVAQSSNGGQTLSFQELNKGSRFTYTDNPPRNAHSKRPSFSMGDQITLANPLVDSSGKLGELRATCTFTKAGPANDNINPARPLCTGAFVMKNGTVFVVTADAGGRTTEGAVTGGTGAYIGARGTFTSNATKSGANDTIDLMP